MLKIEDLRICVIGMGYVGLPLAIEFGKQYITHGFDISEQRINELRRFIDRTNEVSYHDFKQAKDLNFTCLRDEIEDSQIYIVTVPTPVDQLNKPDVSFLENASRLVGGLLGKGDYVIYESTVYPGATEEVCIPLLEKESGLTLNDGFYVGYSPERINPGDPNRRLTDIQKITSGSCDLALDLVDRLYKTIIAAGTFPTKNIKVAEAAKVIENTQRDLNIALMNELAMVFEKMGIDTNSVLEAAATKWNFISFKPGLVGGHCIGVDPYYLTYKAQKMGYNPEIILAGRRINDNMSAYIADRVEKLANNRNIDCSDSHVLVLGYTFKENCPDIRNTKVKDLVEALGLRFSRVSIYDPWVDVEHISADQKNYFLSSLEEAESYDIVILAVAHDIFLELGDAGIGGLCKNRSVLFDVKGVLSESVVTGRL